MGNVRPILNVFEQALQGCVGGLEAAGASAGLAVAPGEAAAEEGGRTASRRWRAHGRGGWGWARGGGTLRRGCKEITTETGQKLN